MKVRRLKDYAPRSLMGRAALILLLPIITIQLIVGVVFIQRHYENVTRQMTRNIMLDISYIADRIAAAPDAGAALTAVAPTLDALDIELAFSAAPVAARRDWLDLSGRAIVETLSTYPDVTAVDLVSEGRGVLLGLRTPHGLAHVEFSRGRVVARNPHQLLVLMVMASIFLTMISFLFLKNQIRPIRRLAVAAQDFGRGRSPDYRPSGRARCARRAAPSSTCATGSSGTSSSAR
jgi:two-component system, OmpR family, osmolarity sensor histidine kinase EnvZ